MKRNHFAEGLTATLFLTGAAAAVIGQVGGLAAGVSAGVAISVTGAVIAAAVFGLARPRLRTQPVPHRRG